MKNSHNNHATVLTRGNKEETHRSKTLSSHKNDVQSFADGACPCAKV